jgi:hypothetical protein
VKNALKFKLGTWLGGSIWPSGKPTTTTRLETEMTTHDLIVALIGANVGAVLANIAWLVTIRR